MNTHRIWISILNALINFFYSHEVVFSGGVLDKPYRERHFGIGSCKRCHKVEKTMRKKYCAEMLGTKTRFSYKSQITAASIVAAIVLIVMMK